MRKLGLAGASIGLAAAGWQSAALLIASPRFPALPAVVAALGGLGVTTRFWEQLLSTIALSLAGLGAGLVIALALGVPIGFNRFVDLSSRGTVNFLRSLPAVVILPLLVAGAGASVLTALMVTAIVVAFKLVIFVVRAVQDVDPVRHEITYLLRLSRFQALLSVFVPSMLIMLGTGVRLSIQRAYGAVVLSGLVIGTPGLGAMLRLAQINAESDSVIALALVMALVGLLFFYAFSYLEGKLAPWLLER